MKYISISLILLGSFLFTPTLTQAETNTKTSKTAQRIGQSWAADIEIGRTLDQTPLHNDALWNLAARGGFLTYKEPYFFSVGLGVDWTSYHDFMTTSAYAEVMHLWSGLSFQTATGIDQATRPVLSVATGWSLFGVRAKYHFDSTTDYYQVFAMLRIPIGILFLTLTDQL